MGLWGSPKRHYMNQVGFEHQDEEQPKRITLSAGTRLSAILDNSHSDQAAKRESHRNSVRKAGLSPMLAEVPENRSTSEHTNGYSTNVWSGDEKFAAIRNNKQIQKRGGWKRILTIGLVVLLLIIALAVGLGLGLKSKKKSDSPASSSTSIIDSTTDDPSASPSASEAILPEQPPNFPLGTFSFITFLDTIQTNCTANEATWTCPPYTTYYSDTSKAISVFNWVISGTKGAYKISSTSSPFSLDFKNAPLELLDEGKKTERYRFQIRKTRTVSPSMGLTDDNASVECDFADTNLQAIMYTRMAKEYPSDRDPDGAPSNTPWPYAMRIEQSAAGGNNVPACYKTGSNGQRGAKVTDGLEAQDASTLCSCLYKNWHTPM